MGVFVTILKIVGWCALFVVGLWLYDVTRRAPHGRWRNTFPEFRAYQKELTTWRREWKRSLRAYHRAQRRAERERKRSERKRAREHPRFLFPKCNNCGN